MFNWSALWLVKVSRQVFLVEVQKSCFLSDPVIYIMLKHYCEIIAK